MNCPLCKSEIALYCYPRTKVYIDRDNNVVDSDQVEGYTWDESTEAECTECDWSGTVNETGIEDEDKEV